MFFFYLETTGLDASKEVVQIAAKYSDVEFDIYVKPEREFSLQASKITGLELKNENLYYNSNLVISHSKVNAAKSFLQFLKSINSTIILVAHNCFRFDCPTLLNFIKNEGLLNEFSELVAGFADSLPLFKSKLKDKRGTKASYRQEVLAEEFLNASLLSDAHNAANDVCVLQKLVEYKDININRKDILENFKSLYKIMNQGAEKIKFNKIQKTLQCLLVDKNKKEDGGLSVHMIKKMAMTGITFDTVSKCFKSSGPKGIRILLAQDVGGKPRITKSQKIIDSLCTKLGLILSDSCLIAS